MTQRAFRIRFVLGRHDPVPDKKTIHNWVLNFRQTGSALKSKYTGRPQTATGPETVATVRARLSNLHGVMHGNMRIEVFRKFCIEISGCTPT
jgi:transposase